MRFKGNAVSAGFAIGKAFVYKAFDCTVAKTCHPAGDAEPALEEWRQAKRAAKAELDSLIRQMEARGEDKAKIFVAHRDILTDEEIEMSVSDAIVQDGYTADYAVFSVFEAFAQLLAGAKDTLIAERAADLLDVRSRLIRILHHQPERNLAALQEPSVVVAHDLMPSDTATMDRSKVLAIVAEVGGGTSHSAIIARGYGIPAVLGVTGALDFVEDGAELVVDAVEGLVITEPDEDTLAAYRIRAAAFGAQKSETERYRAMECTTADGRQIMIGLNVGDTEYTEDYRNTDFVGLLRTEFLYMQSDHVPTEEEQFSAYRQVLEHAAGKPVTLRTLDIGGDKTLPYLKLPQEENPFLGERALRLCFANETLFMTQLRAALRAAAYGELWIMFPMVGSIDDIRRARSILERAKASLRAEGVPFGEVKVGIMVEIPSIAVMADAAAEEVDFASVGTNDLCQYLCAADRMNQRLGAYYQSMSPAMMRVLGMIADAFNARGKAVSVCGEMAGDPDAAAALVGLGYRKLSMSAGNIAAVKRRLAGLTLAEVKAAAEKAKMAETEEQVKLLFKNGGTIHDGEN